LTKRNRRRYARDSRIRRTGQKVLLLDAKPGRLREERLILHRRGKDVAALVPVQDLALLEALEDRVDLDDARAALAEAREKGTIPWEQIKAELGL